MSPFSWPPMNPEPSPVMPEGHDRLTVGGTIGTFAGIHVCVLATEAGVHALSRDYDAPCRSAPCFTDPAPVFFFSFVIALLTILPPALLLTAIAHRLCCGSFRLRKRRGLLTAVTLCALVAGAWYWLGWMG